MQALAATAGEQNRMRTSVKIVVALAAGLGIALLPRLAGVGAPGQGFASHLDIANHLGTALALIFAGGVLTSLTPCVYPMIPITVGIFGARKAESRAKAAALSATYVLGICVTYSTLGAIAAVSGAPFGNALSKPLLVVPVAIVFVALGLSMFGAFKLQVPTRVAMKISGVRGAGYGGAFAMGLVLGILAAPCTGPVLASILAWVADKRSVALGFWLLFDYAVGMGLLFFLLGTFSLSLPRSGRWMEVVESAFGIAIIAIAVSYIRPFLPALRPSLTAAQLAAASGGLVFIAILGGALDRSFHGDVREKVAKGLALAPAFLGVGLQFGWFGAPIHDAVPWRHDESAALAEARERGAPIMIDFYADWCAECVQLDQRTFSSKDVRAEAERFVPLKIDATDGSLDVFAIQQKYGVKGMPTVLFLDSQGHRTAQNDVIGFLPPDEFTARMRKIE